VAARHGYPALNGSPLVARGKQLAEQTGRTIELLNLLWAEWAGLDISCQFDRADPIAEELLARAATTDLPIAPVLAHTAFGISRWHHGALLEAAEHLDAATDASAEIPEGTLASLLFDLDQLRLPRPFAVYVHDLIGDWRDGSDAEARYEDLIREVPGDRYWELLVLNFAASGAIAVGDFARAERAARRGVEADPEGMSAFWSMAERGYLGAALALQGRLDEGLALLDEAWARYTEMGLRTNGVTLLASRAQALAHGGRIGAAEAALAEAEGELRATGERFTEPAVLLAEAVLRHARREDTREVAAVLRRAAAAAVAGGARGIERRVRSTAEQLGVSL
jgi:tetratricopeptide (TPR) repeat protein